jgi:hypothetical protein
VVSLLPFICLFALSLACFVVAGMMQLMLEERRRRVACFLLPYFLEARGSLKCNLTLLFINSCTIARLVVASVGVVFT